MSGADYAEGGYIDGDYTFVIRLPRKVVVLHMTYPDGTHTGDCAGCRWDQGLCVICGDDHKPRCRAHRGPGEPEWTARELMSGLQDDA